MPKRKQNLKEAGEGVVDYRHKTVTRLNIPPAGLEARVDVERWIMGEWIAEDPEICMGKPVIRGTRIMVKNILGVIAGGYTPDKVLQAYPELTQEMVNAALQYAKGREI